MKMAAYILVIGLSLLAPVKRLDVAKLQPVEAVAISIVKEQIILETDTENMGQGKTVKQALDNLKETASAVIYLDTARYLLISEEAEIYREEIKTHLRSSVKVGEYHGGSVKEEAKYLDAHAEAAKPEAGF